MALVLGRGGGGNSSQMWHTEPGGTGRLSLRKGTFEMRPRR